MTFMSCKFQHAWKQMATKVHFHLLPDKGGTGTDQVRCRGRGSASPRPRCDGTPSASVWSSPRQTPGPPCPYPSDRPPHDATMMHTGGPSAWSNPQISTRQDPMHGILSRRSCHMPVKGVDNPEIDNTGQIFIYVNQEFHCKKSPNTHHEESDFGDNTILLYI